MPKIVHIFIGSIIFIACQIPSACISEQEKVDIIFRYTEFHESCNQENYEKAYSFMSPDYRQIHTLEQFISDSGTFGEEWLELHPNYSLKFSGNRAYLYPQNAANPFFWSGPEYELIKIEGVWYFTGNYTWHLD